MGYIRISIYEIPYLKPGIHYSSVTNSLNRFNASET